MTDQIPANVLAYIATPYTLHPKGLIAAHEDACRLAGKLMRSGIHVFCPIAHCHVIAFLSNIDPRDHAIWIPQNQKLLERCDVLIVAHMDGWQDSKGIEHEIKYFEDCHKPIFDLDPHTMVMTKRKHHLGRILGSLVTDDRISQSIETDAQDRKGLI